jgi:amidase
MPTTAGSLALKDAYANQDSSVAKQLRAAGAIILAKANLSEWANFRSSISSSGWSAINGQTRNPYLLDHNPCGSSSGSAVAVSANLCTLAIGTETNGSIVCPAHANGIVGIKPTVGLISRSGIVPISFTQDTAGPMARSVKDAAICLSVLGAKDNNDSKTLVADRKVFLDYRPFLNPDGLSGKRIGVFLEATHFHQEVTDIFNGALEIMRKAGAEIIPLEKVVETGANKASFNVMLYEFKDGLNKYLAGLDPAIPIHSLEELIAFNTSHPSELQYFDQSLLIKAQEKGDLNSADYKASLEQMLQATRSNGIDKVMTTHKLDAIVAPTGSPAWLTNMEEGDLYLGGSSSPAAQSGYPNITLPMGFIDRLPVGISIFGSAWSEGQLIEIAYAFEQLTQIRRAPEFLVD